MRKFIYTLFIISSFACHPTKKGYVNSIGIYTTSFSKISCDSLLARKVDLNKHILSPKELTELNDIISNLKPTQDSLEQIDARFYGEIETSKEKLKFCGNASSIQLNGSFFSVNDGLRRYLERLDSTN